MMNQIEMRVITQLPRSRVLDFIVDRFWLTGIPDWRVGFDNLGIGRNVTLHIHNEIRDYVERQ